MYLQSCTIGWSRVLCKFVSKANAQQSVSFQFAVTEIYLVSVFLSDFQRPRGHMTEAGGGGGAASAEHTDR